MNHSSSKYFEEYKESTKQSEMYENFVTTEPDGDELMADLHKTNKEIEDEI